MLHALLVEDNPSDVLMVREAMRTAPISADLMIAYDGEQALRFINEFGFEPDLVFLDLTVPNLDSFEFLQRLRNNGDPPVIVLTGSVDPGKRQQAIESGAQDYIIKPTELDEFLNAIRDALERWGGQAAARGL